jgi:hypothetical protein
MKKLISILIAAALLMAVALVFTSCSNDDNGPTASTTSKILFKAEASEGSVLRTITYGYDSTLQTVSNAGSQTWTSVEITAPENANVATVTANAIGADNSATLTVKIYVDGILKKEITSTGSALAAVAQYNLK